MNQDEEKLLAQNNAFAKTSGVFKYEGRDILLQMLSYMANVENLHFPITLFVGGNMITGLTISNYEFSSSFIENMELNLEELPNDSKKIIQNKYFDRLFNKTSEEEKDDESTYYVEEVNYIHLANAKLYAGLGKGSPSGGTLWRGKIESVDGFFFGILESGK